MSTARGSGGATTTTGTGGNSNEPKDSKFKQQNLPAWQPILTAGTVLPAFFVIGVAFVPIGVGLMYFSNQVHEAAVEYTSCMNSQGESCQEVVSSYVEGKPKSCVCEIAIPEEQTGTTDWEGNVYLYYGLTNFYQNHRRYVKSRDDKQLYGDLSSEDPDCDPFLHPSNGNDTSKTYAPCGAIANSLFNDTIVLQYRDKNTNNPWMNVLVDRTGIAWESDKTYKFKNPNGENSIEKLKENFKNTVKPMDWQKEIWELDVEDENNNGFLNEDLIVWMRTAALPNFRKLYRKVRHVENTDFATGLPVEKYEFQLNITYNYKVAQFGGTKKVILATTSLMGGKNPFLGIAYIVVGCICFLMGIVFLFIHLRFGRTTQEMMNIGPRSQYNAN